jgi:hypothetical protein
MPSLRHGLAKVLAVENMDDVLGSIIDVLGHQPFTSYLGMISWRPWQETRPQLGLLTQKLTMAICLATNIITRLKPAY